MADQDRRDVPHQHVVGHSGVWQPQVGAPRADSPLGYREPGAAPRQDVGTGGYFNPSGYGSGFGAGGSETRASLDEHSEGAYGARSGARASMTAGRGPGGGVNVEPGFDPGFDPREQGGAPRGGFRPPQGPTHDWGPNRMAGERRWSDERYAAREHGHELRPGYDERYGPDDRGRGNRHAESERYSGGDDRRFAGDRFEDRRFHDRGAYEYRDVGWVGARQDSDWRDIEHRRSDQPPALDPNRRRGPKNYQRSDERLRELISEKLIDHPYIDSSDVSITVVSGEVTLEGTVEDRRTKYLIEEQIDGIHGVRDVDNRLKVRRGLLSGLFGGREEPRRDESSAGEHGGWTTKGSASSEGPATDQSGGSQGGTHQYGRPT